MSARTVVAPCCSATNNVCAAPIAKTRFLWTRVRIVSYQMRPVDCHARRPSSPGGVAELLAVLHGEPEDSSVETVRDSGRFVGAVDVRVTARWLAFASPNRSEQRWSVRRGWLAR
jgi:hypothetical protein